MKTAIACLLLFITAIAGSCNVEAKTPPTLETITPLSIDQVQQLLPFMIDLKKSGQLVRRNLKSELSPGQSLVQHQNSQTYTFGVLLDDNDHPVMPPKDGQPIAIGRSPSRHNGTFEVVCIGGCTVNTSGGPGCTIVGCDPVDNACGCTPIDCPGCLSAGCLAGGSGALVGKVIMF